MCRTRTAGNSVVDDTLSETGRIDILVNNAGILAFATLEDTDPDLFRRLLEINVTGSFLGLRAVIPAMKAAGSGAIVNLSSSAAILPHNATGGIRRQQVRDSRHDTCRGTRTRAFRYQGQLRTPG